MTTKNRRIQEPQKANLTSSDMKAAIIKLQRRIDELREFDANSVSRRGDPRIESIEHKIEDTLVETFGTGTIEYIRYKIGSLDRAPWNFYEQVSLEEVIHGYQNGIEEAISTLETIVQIFNEKLNDTESAQEQGNVISEVINNANMIGSTEENTKIFIVHGRDEHLKQASARFVEKLGFIPVILHEQANAGQTIIEKIEEHTNVGFALVLYTPCDIGGLADTIDQRPRARQNVVFEHGYLIAKLGRTNVCALVKGDVEVPSDISGIIYTIFDENNAWQVSVAKELRNAGYKVDMNKII